jgi:hypothetical protein
MHAAHMPDAQRAISATVCGGSKLRPVNYCPPGGGSQQPRRALGLIAHTTSGLSPFHLPSALKAEVVSAATAKHDTQGLGGGCRQPLNHISKTEAISDWGWEFFVGSA